MIPPGNYVMDNGPVKNIQHLLQERVIEGISLDLIDSVIVGDSILHRIVMVRRVVFQRFDFDRHVLFEESP